MDVNQRWPLRFRYPIIALAGLLVVMVGLVSGGTSADLDRDAGHRLLRLPRSSVADVLLSDNGQLAVVNAVAFDREKGVPERIAYVVDLQAQRLQSQLVLPAVSCCAFPVFSTTADGQVVAIGGADRVELFNPGGAKLMDVALKDPAFNTALKLSRDGRIVVAGQSSGRITAFRRGRPQLLWSTQIGGDLLDLAISEDGRTVLAATLGGGVLILAGASGSVLRRIPLEPALPVAVAPPVNGGRIAMAWKRNPWQSRGARVFVAMFSNGRWAWRHALQEGTLPLVQVDASGKWVAIGDLMGAQAALVSGTGKIAWRSGAKRAAVTVAGDGRAAIAEWSRVEIRNPAGQVIWRATLPGVAHVLRLAGPTLAVLGSKDSQDVVADHLWFVHVGAEPR